MKNLVKPAAMIMAFVIANLQEPAMAAGGPYSKFSAIAANELGAASFTAVLQTQEAGDVISLQIENPSRKNLTVTLLDPEGATLDVFYTGRKFVKMNRQYNFFGASEGVYNIVISDAINHIEKKIKIERITTAPVTRLTVQ